jgi:AraC-like DNA-binding protein
MVCKRCKMVVQSEIEKLGLTTINIDLGEVEILEDIDDSQKSLLNYQLMLFGFELIDDKKSRIIEQVKNLIVELVHHQDNQTKYNLSDLISQKLILEYNYVSNLFSEVEGISIEQYYISQKIEKVKELMIYDENSLSEIAFRLNYSSVAHLSNQFKKVTGLTPTHFKTLKDKKRQPIEEL